MFFYTVQQILSSSCKLKVFVLWTFSSDSNNVVRAWGIFNSKNKWPYLQPIAHGSKCINGVFIFRVGFRTERVPLLFIGLFLVLNEWFRIISHCQNHLHWLSKQRLLSCRGTPFSLAGGLSASSIVFQSSNALISIWGGGQIHLFRKLQFLSVFGHSESRAW